MRVSHLWTMGFFISLLLLLTACAAPETEESGFRMPDKLGRFEVDNDTPLSELLTVEYGIEELLAYFPMTDWEEISVYEGSQTEAPLSIEEVDEVFPIECLRLNNNIYYTVYRVKEGGAFYVFWRAVFELDQNMETPEEARDGRLYETRYLIAPHRRADFRSIVIGKNSAEDVGRIDQALEIKFGMGSGPYSYSLLEKNKIMVIRYDSFDKPINGRDDLIVIEKKVFDHVSEGSYVASIFPEDLPW